MSHAIKSGDIFSHYSQLFVRNLPIKRKKKKSGVFVSSKLHDIILMNCTTLIIIFITIAFLFCFYVLRDRSCEEMAGINTEG